FASFLLKMFNQVLCRWFYYTLNDTAAARCNICEFFVISRGLFVHFSLQCCPVWWYNKHITQNIVFQPGAGLIPAERKSPAVFGGWRWKIPSFCSWRTRRCASC